MAAKDELSVPILSIIKDAVKYIPSRIVPAAAGFFAIATYTRLIDPKDYGYYVLVATTIKTITVMTIVWLDKASLRYFEEFRSKNNLSVFISTGLTSIFILFISVGIILYLVLTLLGPRMDSQLSYLFKVGIMAFLVDSGMLYFLTILRANRQSTKYSTYTAIGSVLKVSIALGFIYFFHLGSESILWGTIFASGIICLLEAITFIKVWHYRLSKVSKAVLKKMCLYGFPLIGQSIGMMILSISDRYMIQYFLGAKEVGIYSAGYNMISMIIVSLLIGLLLLAAFPIIIQVFEKSGSKKAKTLLRDLIGLYNLILIPIVFGVAAISKDMTSIFFGKEFYQSFIILPWVAGGLYFWGLTTYVIKSFELTEKTPNITYLVLLAALVNVVLNILFIPKFGVIGAAFATLVAYLCCFVTALITSKKQMEISVPWKSMIKSGLSAMVMLIFILYVMPSETGKIGYLVLNIGAGAFVYLSLLIVLREEFVFRPLAFLKK